MHRDRTRRIPPRGVRVSRPPRPLASPSKHRLGTRATPKKISSPVRRPTVDALLSDAVPSRSRSTHRRAGPPPKPARRCCTWTPRTPTAARGASCASHPTTSAGSYPPRGTNDAGCTPPATSRSIQTRSRSPHAAHPSRAWRTPRGPRYAPTQPPRRRRWATGGDSRWTSPRPSCASEPTVSSTRSSTPGRTSTASSRRSIRRGCCGTGARTRCRRRARRCSGTGT